jgi:hypothetical protein
VSEQPEDAVFEEVEGGPAQAAPRRALVHTPRVRRRGRLVDIVGMREVDTGPSPVFWAGLVFLLGGISTLYMKGSSGFHSMTDVALAVVILGGLALVVKFGAKETRRPEVLATLDEERGEITWPMGEGSLAVSFEELQEVVFAMVRFPVAARVPEAAVRMYVLLVRDGRGELVPVVEASPDQREVFLIGKALSQIAGVELTQVGEGVLSR